MFLVFALVGGGSFQQQRSSSSAQLIVPACQCQQSCNMHVTATSDQQITRGMPCLHVCYDCLSRDFGVFPKLARQCSFGIVLSGQLLLNPLSLRDVGTAPLTMPVLLRSDSFDVKRSMFKELQRLSNHGSQLPSYSRLHTRDTAAMAVLIL